MKCIRCGWSNTKNNPVTKRPDPYDSDSNGDDTEVWECENCRDILADEI